MASLPAEKKRKKGLDPEHNLRLLKHMDVTGHSMIQN